MNTFEDRLLAELRQVVAARAESGQASPLVKRPAPHRRHRRLRVAGAGLLAAAGLAIGLPIALGEIGSKANAVERDPDGSFRIYVRDFQHPEVIERRLRGFGVRSDVTFLPSGKRCQEPRATYMREDDPRKSTLLQWGDETFEEQYLRLDPKRIKAEETFVLTVWYTEHGDTSASESVGDLATGPVGPCRMVPGGLGFTMGPDGVEGVTPGPPTPTPTPRS